MSKFKLLSQSCGLTMQAAAGFLDVRPDTAKSWWLDKRTCPDPVLLALQELFDRIDGAAEQVITLIEEQDPPGIEIGVAVDDTEAQALGLPTVGAHHAMCRRILELADPDYLLKIRFVPRGSTPGTAGAADAHCKVLK